MSIDLHCHSRISDGSLGVDELLSIARRRRLTAISITDHDAVVGSTRAVILGKRMGIEVIPGVEFPPGTTPGATKPTCWAICATVRTGWRGCAAGSTSAAGRQPTR